MCKNIVYKFTCGHRADPAAYGTGVDKCNKAQESGFNCSVRRRTVNKEHPAGGVCEKCEDAEDAGYETEATEQREYRQDPLARPCRSVFSSWRR